MSASERALADVLERLAAPTPPEWSALTGVPVLVVDATGAELTGTTPEAVARAVRRLGALTGPSVALVDARPAAAMRTLLDGFDVVVTTRDDLAAVVAAVEGAPFAAATLVQVLRPGVGLPVDAALTLESLAYATLQAGPEHAAWLRARPAAPARETDAEPVVRMAREGERLVVTLDRPARHNAFSARMRDELHAALLVTAAEPSLAVVLRGAGPSFSSGGDLDEFGTRPDPATAHLVRMTRSPARVLAARASRVTVELHGACIGAGIELAAFAGRVVAAPDAFFQLPELGMGLIPGAGGTVSIPRRIGRQRTAWLALTGRRLDAATARAWGLIDAIAGADRVS